MQELFAEWSMRTTFSECSLTNLEPVLKVRRALLEIHIDRLTAGGQVKSSNQPVLDQLESELKNCWLLSAKAARKAGQLSKAYNVLLEAKRFDKNHKPLFIEQVKS